MEKISPYIGDTPFEFGENDNHIFFLFYFNIKLTNFYKIIKNYGKRSIILLNIQY